MQRSKVVLLIAMTGVPVLGICAALVYVMSSGHDPPPPPQCDIGYYLKNTECIPSPEPVDKYARCIVRDAKAKFSKDTGSAVHAKVQEAKASVDTAVDFKKKFEKSVEATTDRYVLLDISARCFELARDMATVTVGTGNPTVPEGAQGRATTGLRKQAATHTAAGPTARSTQPKTTGSSTESTVSSPSAIGASPKCAPGSTVMEFRAAFPNPGMGCGSPGRDALRANEKLTWNVKDDAGEWRSCYCKLATSQ